MQNPSNLKGCLVVLLIGVLASWGIYQFRYQWSYASDLKNKPWAYSENKNDKLLIGKWAGSFTDPDGVAKSLELEIFVPMTDEQRKEKAVKRPKRKRSKKEPRLFEGAAMVKSRLGTEEYTLYGSVAEGDYHQLDQVQFGSKDESKRILQNFALNLSEQGHWEGDVLTLELQFSYLTSSGSSFWDSADPRHEKRVPVRLKR